MVPVFVPENQSVPRRLVLYNVRRGNHFPTLTCLHDFGSDGLRMALGRSPPRQVYCQGLALVIDQMLDGYFARAY